MAAAQLFDPYSTCGMLNRLLLVDSPPYERRDPSSSFTYARSGDRTWDKRWSGRPSVGGLPMSESPIAGFGKTMPRISLAWIAALGVCLVALPGLANDIAGMPVNPSSASLGCVDAAGHLAWCGPSPKEHHECRAGDHFGRCPNDPACFNDQWKQVSCMGLVLPNEVAGGMRVVPTSAPLGCVDLFGHHAWCGPSPTEWHECRAAGPFGRCPNDPACFDEQRKEVSCLGPVHPMTKP